MMKSTRTLAFLSAACLALTGAGAGPAPLAAQAVIEIPGAQTGVLDGMKYSVQFGYCMITGYDDTLPADLTIPAEINGVKVTRIDSDAFDECTKLHSVTIPDTVTELAYGCFRDCTELETIRFPEQIEYFGQCAVQGTKWLSDHQAGNRLVTASNVVVDGTCCTGEVTIPDGITIIGIHAFVENKNITAVSFPHSLKTIDNWAFSGCSGLKELTLPGSLEIIDMGSFEKCTGLESVILENGIQKLEDEVFQSCTSLKSVTFPDVSLTRISGAFSHCDALREVTIPAGVKVVDMEAFTDCASLETVTVLGYYTCMGDQYWSYAAFSNEKSKKDEFVYNGKIRGYNGSFAEQYAEHFGVSFESLGDAPVSGACGDQMTWKLQDGVLTVSGSGEMYNYFGLVTINGKLEMSSYQGAAPWFMYRDQVKEVVIGPDVEEIASGAFADIDGMESITFLKPDCLIPYARYTISNGADENGKANFTGVIRGYSDSAAQKYAEQYAYRFEEITEALPGTTTTAPAAVTTKPAAVTTKPAAVTTKPAAATTKPAAVTTKPAAVTTKPAAATTEPATATTKPAAATTKPAASTASVTTYLVTMTAAETSVYDDTFRGTCGDSATWAFNLVTGNLLIGGEGDMTDYDIDNHEAAPWIDYAVSGDPFHPLRSVTIEQGITRIGAGAFTACADVQKIVVPVSVGSIGENAFYLCGGLDRLTILNPACKIADSAWTVSSGIRNNEAFFNGTIVGFPDSTAQKYAEKYGYNFEALDLDPLSVCPNEGMLGYLKVVPYLHADGYSEEEQAAYQKSADAFMKKVKTITMTGDMQIQFEDSDEVHFLPDETTPIADDPAAIAKLSAYDSAPIVFAVLPKECAGEDNPDVIIRFLDADGAELLSCGCLCESQGRRSDVTFYYDKFMLVADLSKADAGTSAENEREFLLLKSKTAGSEYETADYDCPTTLGDLDGSKDVSVSDAQLALKAYTEQVAGKASGLDKGQSVAADVNRDGAVSVEDAQLILKYYTEKYVAGKNLAWKDLLK